MIPRFTILLLFIATLVRAQDYTKPFTKEDFPPDKFQIRYETFPFHRLIIEFILVKELQPVFDSGECITYLNVWNDKKIVNRKNLGMTWSEGRFGIPKTQPIEKYFVFSYFGEWNGEMSLIDTSGKLISFPGYYWAITSDKKYICTKAIYPSSELNITKFNVESGKFITKEWNNELNGEPWEEVQPSDYRGLEI